MDILTCKWIWLKTKHNISVKISTLRTSASGWIFKRTNKQKTCIQCVPVFNCFCFHGAVSNRGRHDRVGKARERARGKGATSKAHAAGARGPGARHRSKQVWTLLRKLPSHLAELCTAQRGPGWPGPAQKTPKQHGDMYRTDSASAGPIQRLKTDTWVV